MAEAIQKTYVHKISRAGRFLGVLDNVKSEFNYTNLINTGMCQLQIVVGKDPLQTEDAVAALLTESSSLLMTESGELLTTERSYPIVGNDHDDTIIRSNNDVEVYEISSDYPNGKLVFSGYISKWRANFGGTGDITITVLSYGAKLDKSIVQVGGYSAEISQGSTNNTDQVISPDHAPRTFLSQTFTPTGNFTLAKIRLSAKADTGGLTAVVVDFYRGTPGSGVLLNTLSTIGVQITNTVAALIDIILPVPIAFVSGTQYYFDVKVAPVPPSDPSATISLSTANPYANGQLYKSTNSGSTYSVQAGKDLVFVLYSSGGSIESPFLNTDPSDMIRDMLDDFASKGGRVSYDTDSIDDTGILTDYTFKLATDLEGIQKARELAPSGWYWYVDPATSLLNFHAQNETPDIVFTKGVHVSELNVEANIEEVFNTLYFSGGDLGSGINLFKIGQDSDSRNLYGQNVARITDNRVILSDTAQAVIDSFLAENSPEQFTCPLRIFANTFDITTLAPGLTVGFQGYGNMVDRLILQISVCKRSPHFADLTLGLLPRRTSKTIDDLLRGLNDEQTIDNPAAPS